MPTVRLSNFFPSSFFLPSSYFQSLHNSFIHLSFVVSISLALASLLISSPDKGQAIGSALHQHPRSFASLSFIYLAHPSLLTHALVSLTCFFVIGYLPLHAHNSSILVGSPPFAVTSFSTSS